MGNNDNFKFSVLASYFIDDFVALLSQTTHNALQNEDNKVGDQLKLEWLRFNRKGKYNGRHCQNVCM